MDTSTTSRYSQRTHALCCDALYWYLNVTLHVALLTPQLRRQSSVVACPRRGLFAWLRSERCNWKTTMSRRRRDSAVRQSPQPPPVCLLRVLLLAVVSVSASGKSFVSLREVVWCGKWTRRSTISCSGGWIANLLLTVSSPQYAILICVARVLSSSVFRLSFYTVRESSTRYTFSPCVGSFTSADINTR